MSFYKQKEEGGLFPTHTRMQVVFGGDLIVNFHSVPPASMLSSLPPLPPQSPQSSIHTLGPHRGPGNHTTNTD